MKEQNLKITYTITDEAPFLATHSLLPIINKFVSIANIKLETKDISLAARVLATFPEYLENNQLVENALEELGKMVKDSNANIIKLPNISASIPQLTATINELQEKGYNIPSYPIAPKNQNEKQIKARYDKVKGSAVNPVLREGNSDRRAPIAVKNYVKTNPHYMGEWKSNSNTHVSTMKANDFHHNEKSICAKNNTDLKIILECNNGKKEILKDQIKVKKNEIIDASFMSKKALLNFFENEFKDAKENNVLLSLHMKATMMKVSDPIIFGHAVNTYFKKLITKHSNLLNNLAVDFKNGFGDLTEKIKNLPSKLKSEIEKDINDIFINNADLAMVNSDLGITNLHIPSDIIIDASMPAMIRNSGKMWNKNNETVDTKAVIPDSSYAKIYSATIEFCKKNGAFDPTTMGTVPNVGLMAKKAEEYGSHDKTFEIPNDGIINVVNSDNEVVISHKVSKGDIWRMCLTKDESIKDWVKLAVNRAKATGWPAIFWLNKNRAHDNQLIKKVKSYLKDLDLKDLDIQIMPPYEATIYSLERIKKGLNTISVTGNVLRDYLTDLFPILELGTSAKMLSIVPLMNGGKLFETGAGGSAPKHVDQLIKEGHLRWDSLGEFLALAESLKHLGEKNKKAKILGNCLEMAIEKLLKNGHSPKRKCNDLDNRGSHFYLSLYWAEELCLQNEDLDLKNYFNILEDELKENKSLIINEIQERQGNKEDLKGYYFPDKESILKIMRPSKTLNQILIK